MPKDTNPLGWWKQNAFRFPAIGMVARSSLFIPTTSTPSERLFSAAGLTVTKLQSSLKYQNVDALLFVNKNYNLLYKNLLNNHN